MLKKALLPIAAVIICYFVNPVLGLVATVIGLAITAYCLMPNIYAFNGNKAFSDGDLEAANKWYSRCIGTGRASDGLKLAYAFLLLRSGKPVESERVLNEIARKKTAKPEDKLRARQYRCMAYCKQNRMDEAMEEAQELFRDYKTTMTYGIMGYFMLLTNAPIDETVKLCEEACAYNSDDRDILDNMALAYYRAGELKKAQEYTEKLMETSPTFVEAFYHGALVENKLGNKDKAREYLAKIPECKRSYMTTVSQEEIDALATEVQ